VKNFDEVTPAYQPNGSDEERIFQLGGVELMRVRTLPASVVLDIAKAVHSDDDMEAIYALGQAVRSMIVPAYRESFERALRMEDPETGEAVVSMEKLNEVAWWIIGETTNRPPTPASDSPSSPTANGTTSMVNSPAEASTSVPSTPVNSAT